VATQIKIAAYKLYTWALRAIKFDFVGPKGRHWLKMAMPHVEKRINENQNFRGSALPTLETGGRRCFIVGSGPSAQKTYDFDRADFFIFLNKSIILNECLNVANYALLVSDQSAIEELVKTKPDLSGGHIFAAVRLDVSSLSSKTPFRFRIWHRPYMYDGFFETNLQKPLYPCHTVAAYALQIAAGLGFKSINLVGIDLDFSKADPHFYESSKGELARAENSRRRQAFMVQGLLYGCAHLESTLKISVYTNSENRALSELKRF
jgi:hypothetical protein